MVRTNPIKQRYGKTPPKGDIVPMTDEMKEAAKTGASGGLGLIAGVAGNVAKSLPTIGAFFNTARQYLSRSFGKKAPVSNFRPLVTGNKVHNTESINKAFSARFNTASPTPPKPVTGGYSKINGQWENAPDLMSQSSNVLNTVKYNKHLRGPQL